MSIEAMFKDILFLFTATDPTIQHSTSPKIEDIYCGTIEDMDLKKLSVAIRSLQKRVPPLVEAIKKFRQRLILPPPEHESVVFWLLGSTEFPHFSKRTNVTRLENLLKEYTTLIDMLTMLEELEHNWLALLFPQDQITEPWYEIVSGWRVVLRSRIEEVEEPQTVPINKGALKKSILKLVVFLQGK
jgi:hypothetical protein